MAKKVAAAMPLRQLGSGAVRSLGRHERVRGERGSERTNKEGKNNLARLRSIGRSRSVGRLSLPTYGMTVAVAMRALSVRPSSASLRSLLMILSTSSFFSGGGGGGCERGGGVRTCDVRDSSGLADG